jgi:hypothetical protein
VKPIAHTPQLGELKIVCPADVAAMHSSYDCFMLTDHAAILCAAFVYHASYVFLFPFHGLVDAPATGGMVLELSSFIALLIYALLARGIGWLVRVPSLSPAPVTGWHHPDDGSCTGCRNGW